MPSALRESTEVWYLPGGKYSGGKYAANLPFSRDGTYRTDEPFSSISTTSLPSKSLFLMRSCNGAL